MVASSVASKGLDFNDIQHVIIFSMPKEIEDYVHQIGRTGRSGKTGIATTFVNMGTPEQTLLDLKYLLMEAGQKCVGSLSTTRFHVLVLNWMRRVPPFLQTIQDPRAAQGGSLTGCPVCGGKVVLVLSTRDIHAPFRSRSRHLKLSQVGGRTTPTDGVAEGRTRRRGWLLASVRCPLRDASSLVIASCFVSVFVSRYSDNGSYSNV